MANAQAKAMINIPKQHFIYQQIKAFTLSEALICVYLSQSINQTNQNKKCQH